MTMELTLGAALLTVLAVLGCWLSLQVSHASTRRGLIALSLLVPLLLSAVALELYIIVRSTAVSHPVPVMQWASTGAHLEVVRSQAKSDFLGATS